MHNLLDCRKTLKMKINTKKLLEKNWKKWENENKNWKIKGKIMKMEEMKWKSRIKREKMK